MACRSLLDHEVGVRRGGWNGASFVAVASATPATASAATADVRTCSTGGDGGSVTHGR